MDKEKLESAVSKGLSQRQIAKEMKCGQTTVRYWLKKHGLKTQYRPIPCHRSWTDEQLKNAVARCKTVAGVLRALGLRVLGGNYRHIKKHIDRLGLDTSHFTGKASGRGGWKRPLSEILIENSTYTNITRLKKRLLEANLLENQCSICGLCDTWNEKPIVLVLDHINGHNRDHRLGNLRLLCPNCNSQQPTFCRGNGD